MGVPLAFKLYLLLALLLASQMCHAAPDPTLGMLPTFQPPIMQDGTATEARQYIPRIIHQSYLPNEQALERLSTAPRSHFRRDWRRSCQVHNPGYEYMFWDETNANAFIKEHYPDMLPYYNRVSKYVLKSDILRVMILDKLGGVWLDIDTECFAPVDPILRGFHLVAQAEWSYQLCNSHVAGIPGHPVWRRLMQWFIRKVEAGVTDPLKHTGPVALTKVTKDHMQPANAKNMSAIVGAWVDPQYPSKFRAYGLQEAWFLPCKWARSYMSPCQGALARSKAIVRQLANGVTTSMALVQQPGTHAVVKQLVLEAQTFRNIRGSHEYSNSWTKWQFSDGLKTMVRAKEALNGLLPFFGTPGLFEEYHGWVQGGCVANDIDHGALMQHQLCGAALRAAAARDACRVLSIRGRRDQQMDGSGLEMSLGLEKVIVEQYGCHVEVVTLQPRRQQEVSHEGRLVVRSEPMQLGPYYDQYSLPPTYTLPMLLDAVLPAGHNLTLLHIDCGADCALWEVLNQLQLTGSLALRRVGSVLLDLGNLPLRKRHMLNTVYQHLYQEVGLVGYSWGRSARRPAGGGSLGRMPMGMADAAAEGDDDGIADDFDDGQAQGTVQPVTRRMLLDQHHAAHTGSLTERHMGTDIKQTASEGGLGSSRGDQEAVTSLQGAAGGQAGIAVGEINDIAWQEGQVDTQASQRHLMLLPAGRKPDFALGPLKLGFACVL